MNRVTRRIVAYLTLISGLVLAAFSVLAWPMSWNHLLLGAALLLPGRLQGMLWRSFFRGRHAMNRNDLAKAEDHFVSFLEKLRQQSWLKHATFLAWNFYTWNPEAMTRNNLGACRIALGKFELAETELRQALALDPGFPLPYFNLAVLAHARDMDAEAERLRAVAARLGYRAATRERIILSAGSALAAIEGRF